MGVRLGKALLNVGAKNQLANAERQVVSRRPGTLDKEGLERLPTSNMIAASEMMKAKHAEVVERDTFDPELGKHLATLTGSIQHHSDFVLPKRAEAEYVDSLPRIETHVMGEILAFAHDEYYAGNHTVPQAHTVAERFEVDEAVVAEILRYNGLAQTVGRVDEGEKITLGLWAYDRPNDSNE